MGEMMFQKFKKSSKFIVVLSIDNSSLKRSFKMEYIQKELERLRGGVE